MILDVYKNGIGIEVKDEDLANTMRELLELAECSPKNQSQSRMDRIYIYRSILNSLKIPYNKPEKS